MTGYGIIGESIGFRANGVSEQAISELNLVGVWFNPEPCARAFGSGVNLTSIYSIKRFDENPARFFDFPFFSTPVYMCIMSLIHLPYLALTIRFYS